MVEHAPGDLAYTRDQLNRCGRSIGETIHLAGEDDSMEVREGGLAFEVPASNDDVFYNPRMELNRDLTVAALSVAREQLFAHEQPSYLDAMAAAGVRGVRAAHEGYDVTLCDVAPEAIEASRRNLERNDLDGRTVRDDVRIELYRNRYDVVDIDPFGSPVPFLDAAVSNTNRLLCVTATDTAPLCGAHFEAGVRRYSAIPANTEYHGEVGLRVLLSAVARTAARYDIAIRPLCAHTTRHYHRAYLDIDPGAQRADAVIDGLGYVIHCWACLAREVEPGLAPALPATCSHCGSDDIARIGPLWLDAYVDRAFVSSMRSALDESMNEARAGSRLLTRLAEELAIPYHFDHHQLCDELGVPATAIDGLLDALEAEGFTATRAHFSGTAFKTDAPIETVLSAVENQAPNS